MSIVTVTVTFRTLVIGVFGVLCGVACASPISAASPGDADGVASIIAPVALASVDVDVALAALAVLRIARGTSAGSDASVAGARSAAQSTIAPPPYHPPQPPSFGTCATGPMIQRLRPRVRTGAGRWVVGCGGGGIGGIGGSGAAHTERWSRRQMRGRRWWRRCARRWGGNGVRSSGGYGGAHGGLPPPPNARRREAAGAASAARQMCMPARPS